MTTNEILAFADRTRIKLAVHGDRLRVQAPVGTITPSLRQGIALHKWELLDRLSPSSRYITLKNGQTLPVVAVQLALDLERRGIPLHTDANHQFIMPDDERLTDADRRAIQRWRLHLSAIVEYEAPKIA
jgi:hypothetical protein